MLTPDLAWEIILNWVRPLPEQVAPLPEALGHCLAETVTADRDWPACDCSAMDGYAVRTEDLESAPRSLRLVGEVAAGSPARPEVTAGSCVRIFTGACVPPGADAVVPKEDTEVRQGEVWFRSSVAAGANILRRGENARKGAVLLRPGQRLSAADIGILAAVGKATVRVHRRPRVKMLCTGSELREAAERPRRHEIRNSVGPAISAALADWGLGRARYATVRDEPPAIVAAVRRALRAADVVLLTGGVSVGRYDFVPEAIRAIGAAIRFHGVAMKPGKPTLFATTESGRLIFGLPGNPLSALTAFHEFVLPALRRLSGSPAELCRIGWRLPLAENVTPHAGLVRYVLTRVLNHQGGPQLLPLPSHGSADLASAAAADGVAILPPGDEVLAAARLVAFRPWRPLP